MEFENNWPYSCDKNQFVPFRTDVARAESTFAHDYAGPHIYMGSSRKGEKKRKAD